MPAGICYLVGAGPGDPGLITVRGLECLRRADVVIYDRLVNPELLREAPSSAELIYAGKEPGRDGLSQAEINDLLVERASRGLTVVRLKGGDPFVFGRGGEEAQALVAHRLPFEVVPGVSSAIAAPAYAGIPVTHREHAASVAFVTGHEDSGKTSNNVDWEWFAKGPDTLVLMMGIAHLEEITDRLIQHGRPADTPVAVVRWGTVPEQETVVGTLADISQRVRDRGLRPPAVTVVGDVVRLREHLRWFDTRPLFGKRVLVTRTREQASELSRRLRVLGATPVEFPVIEVEPAPLGGPLDRELQRLDRYAWVVFTSVNGVRFVWERLRAAGRDARAFATARIAAIGPGTANALAEIGIAADYVPERFIAESVAEGLPDVTSGPILLPRADIAREALVVLLRERGADVVDVAAYHTRPARPTPADIERLRRAPIDLITFTSSSTVTNFLAAVSDHQELVASARIASIGPITSGTARAHGLRVDIEAAEHTIPGLVAAIEQYYSGSLVQ